MDSIVVVKVIMQEESLLQDIEGEVISVYTVKSIFDGMKKTYMNTTLIEMHTFVSYTMGMVRRHIFYIPKGL
ncbi:hypothetical protein Taro_049230 [Colocasia esculenta]|uniref:Uncharacterized protein n=1 Tax=Colocasia esculenta TaxID=4460 RepID=A0A843XA78_COLES|nr:hypothetical protein [Colocasia esculenta]